MTREELIKRRKIWRVYIDNAPDDILFESCKTKAFKFIKDNFGMRAYKLGMARVAYLIYEV